MSGKRRLTRDEFDTICNLVEEIHPLELTGAILAGARLNGSADDVADAFARWRQAYVKEASE